MIEIGRTLISRAVVEEYFSCNLAECKGACCMEGDSGAPLTLEEVKQIKKEYPVIEKYLPEEHRREIQKQGFSVIDHDNDTVTPLVKGQQCAYSFFDEQGMLKCSIEKAFLNGKTSFRKPVSCHLFPIRITEYKNFDAVNYEKLEICKPGRVYGKSQQTKLYRLLKEALTRKYGEEWYKKLEIAAKYLIS